MPDRNPIDWRHLPTGGQPGILVGKNRGERSMTTEEMTAIHIPSAVRKMGIEALTRELGAVGMACFIRQFDPGEGDYTREREALLSGTTMADIERQLAEAQH